MFKVDPQTVVDHDGRDVFVHAGKLHFRLADGSVVRCQCCTPQMAAAVADALAEHPAEVVINLPAVIEGPAVPVQVDPKPAEGEAECGEHAAG